MSEPSYGKIINDGLWHNNPGLVQLLGLCPLLAVTTSVINGLGLGLATTLTLVTTNVTVSLSRKLIRPEVRIPVYVLLIASVVTVIELGMNAWFHGLYKVLGIFSPLIVVNCNIIGRAEAFASKHSVDRALIDGLAMGAGFTLVLILLGGLRELLGHGTLFAQAQLMFGESGRALSLTLIENYRGFLLAILPPGAFMGLGLMIAARNVINARREQRAHARELPVAPPTRA
jgi:electron transport complex protein RnfE